MSPRRNVFSRLHPGRRSSSPALKQKCTRPCDEADDAASSCGRWASVPGWSQHHRAAAGWWCSSARRQAWHDSAQLRDGRDICPGTAEYGVTGGTSCCSGAQATSGTALTSSMLWCCSPAGLLTKQAPVPWSSKAWQNVRWSEEAASPQWLSRRPGRWGVASLSWFQPWFQLVLSGTWRVDICRRGQSRQHWRCPQVCRIRWFQAGEPSNHLRWQGRHQMLHHSGRSIWHCSAVSIDPASCCLQRNCRGPSSLRAAAPFPENRQKRN